MSGKRQTRLPVNWEYLEKRFKQEGVKQVEVSKLLGYNETYLSYYKSRGEGLPNEAIEKLRDLMELDMKQLIPRKEHEDEVVVATDKTIDVLIQEIGRLENRIAQLERKLEEPVLVSVPMNAEELAVIVMEDLLAGGWCTKDEVIAEFNKRKIPMEYLPKALNRLGAIATTSGHADMTRTFYIGGVK